MADAAGRLEMLRAEGDRVSIAKPGRNVSIFIRPEVHRVPVGCVQHPSDTGKMSVSRRDVVETETYESGGRKNTEEQQRKERQTD